MARNESLVPTLSEIEWALDRNGVMHSHKSRQIEAAKYDVTQKLCHSKITRRETTYVLVLIFNDLSLLYDLVVIISLKEAFEIRNQNLPTLERRSKRISSGINSFIPTQSPELFEVDFGAVTSIDTKEISWIDVRCRKPSILLKLANVGRQTSSLKR